MVQQRRGGAAAAIASAGTRSLIEGSDVGDNILAALPDVIGQTIGEAIVGGIAGVGESFWNVNGTPYDESDDFVVDPTAETTQLRANFDYDGLGRLRHQWDYTTQGETADPAFERIVDYNDQGQVLTDKTYARRLDGGTWKIFGAESTYDYTNVNGEAYALGAPLRIVTVNTVDGAPTSTSKTDYIYEWRDGPQQLEVRYDGDNNNVFENDTDYYYADVGGQPQLTGVVVHDGRPRSVGFVNDLNGQAISRRESDNTSNGDPHEIWYRFNGKLMGYVGNNGTLDTDYQTSTGNRTATSQSGPFRNGSNTSVKHADFDQSVAPLTSYNQGSSYGTYTVRTGETLSSIAAQLWGDSSLWYKLAEANGLAGAQATLIEGQTLIIPTGVVKNTHNASTFTPYDQNEILGETLPTTPKAPKKKGCGTFGIILLVVIAVVVSVVTAGAALTVLAPTLAPTLGAGIGAVIGGSAGLAGVAAGAIGGAVGSIASQGVGVMTGIQEKFSWNAVAMAAIGGGVGAGLGGSETVGKLLNGVNVFGSKIFEAGLRGMLGNAITQGIGDATGLQREDFSWAGVAAAGVGAMVGSAFGAQSILDNRSLGNIAANVGAITARTIAIAATRSAIEGSDFDTNLKSALPDVIGQTIGEAIAGGISSEIQEARAERQRELESVRRGLAALEEPISTNLQHALYVSDDVEGDFQTLKFTDDGSDLLTPTGAAAERLASGSVRSMNARQPYRTSVAAAIAAWEEIAIMTRNDERYAGVELGAILRPRSFDLFGQVTSWGYDRIYIGDASFNDPLKSALGLHEPLARIIHRHPDDLPEHYNLSGSDVTTMRLHGMREQFLIAPDWSLRMYSTQPRQGWTREVIAQVPLWYTTLIDMERR